VAGQSAFVMLNEVKHLGNECRQRLLVVLSPDPSLTLRMTEGAHGRHRIRLHTAGCRDIPLRGRRSIKHS